jgi:cyanate lyase
MLGEPIAAIAEPVDMLRKLDRLAQRIGGSHPLTHRRLIEDAEFRGQRVGTAIAAMRASSLQRSQAMTRDELTRKILAVKRAKSLTWKTIIAEIGSGSAVYLTAALMGQMKLRPEQAERAAKLFGLSEDETRLLQEIPFRGSLPTAVPTDPLIYRFYELVQVYGTTWKELIQEEFGDGIMSAIDFEMTIERQPDPKGDRVKLTLSGKFLPYKEY